VCVYVEQSPAWIKKVAAPSFVTVVPYTYRTRVDEWTTYADLTPAQLHARLFMADLPAYAPYPTLPQHTRRAPSLSAPARGFADGRGDGHGVSVRAVLATTWDVVLVDAPMGFAGDLPGRASPLYTTAYLLRTVRGRPRDAAVHVHDVDRAVRALSIRTRRRKTSDAAAGCS
jgi:hypothetical protein